MADFNRDAKREAAAIARGVTKEEIERRGGINAAGYWGDTYNPNTSLTDAEYAAAIAGKTGLDVGKAINAALETKLAKYNATLPKGGNGATGNEATGNGVAGSTGSSDNPLDTTAADEKLAKRTSAYATLYDEFNKYGLGTLVSDIKDYLINNTFDSSEYSIQLQNTKAYQDRFSANKDRIAKGLGALRPADYILLEDQYQNVMRNYGLPESYYTKGTNGVQLGFNQLIANDVDSGELEERIMTAQNRVNNANPQVLEALKKFYPDIKNGDILAYVLDPKNGKDIIKRKVTAAEIGGAQIGAGLEATLANADALAAAGVTGQRYQQNVPDIAETTVRGSQLASMYGESPYTQQTAEQAILNVPGSAEAIKQTKKLKGLEEASFSGRTGAAQGALGRERAGVL